MSSLVRFANARECVDCGRHGRSHRARVARGRLAARARTTRATTPVTPVTTSETTTSDGDERVRDTSDGDRSRRRRQCVVYDVSRELVSHDECAAWQRALLARALRDGDASVDCALLAQHFETITIGHGSDGEGLKFDERTPPRGFAVARSERGGEATYHGPGQLVLYPILNLARAPHDADLHWYMRALERVAIEAMEHCGLEDCERVEGLTGAWCDGHKLAAVGVRARRWVTYHGVALNVCVNLAHFAHIVPCGIADRPVGSVSQMLRNEPGVISSATAASMDATEEREARDDDEELMQRARDGLINAFAETFDLEVEVRHSAPEV